MSLRFAHPPRPARRPGPVSALDNLGTVLGCLRSIVGSGAVLEFGSAKGKFWMILDDILAFCPEHALARMGWRSANACGDHRQPLPLIVILFEKLYIFW